MKFNNSNFARLNTILDCLDKGFSFLCFSISICLFCDAGAKGKRGKFDVNQNKK